MDMGKTMSTAFLHVKKAFYRYNAPARALKYIEKEKLPVSPRYEKTEEIIEKIKKEFPAVADDLSKKDKNLDGYLQKVYLTSTGENEELTVKKPLPQNRISRGEYIFIEPEIVPQGYCVLSKIVKFLHDHRSDPNLWTAAKIAEDYELEKEKVDIILKYFGTFTVYNQSVRDDGVEIDLAGELYTKTKSILTARSAFVSLEGKSSKDQDETTSEIENLEISKIKVEVKDEKPLKAQPSSK